MYCKKCGTEQEEGQKFCPKCGEPFLDENGKPYLKGIRKDMQNAKDKLATKAEELTQKGKKFIDEKVQPQLNEKIEEAKNTDWNKKQAEAISFIIEFIKDPSKIRLATKILACIFVLWFFIKVGFSASILWYVLISAILFLAFIEPKAIKEGTMLSKYMYIGACFALMLIVALGGKKGRSDNSSGLFGGSSGPREICISLQAETDRGAIPERMKNVLSSSGNYGLFYNEQCFSTDEIIIPNGKMWVYKDYEVHYIGGEGCVPDIRHYFMGYKNERYKTYNCRNDSRNIPIFRSGDKIRILVSRWAENGRKTMDVKVYFVEKDDDLQLNK